MQELGTEWTPTPARKTCPAAGRHPVMWSPDHVETSLRHHSPSWLILTRDAELALPPILQGEPKNPCRDSEQPESGEVCNSLLEAGQGHRGWARALRQPLSWVMASTHLQKERHHISPGCLCSITSSWPLVHPG